MGTLVQLRVTIPEGMYTPAESPTCRLPYVMYCLHDSVESRRDPMWVSWFCAIVSPSPRKYRLVDYWLALGAPWVHSCLCIVSGASREKRPILLYGGVSISMAPYYGQKSIYRSK